MEASTYNVLAPAADGVNSILYNTSSQACAILDPAEASMYSAYASGDEPDDANGRAFVEQLSKMGFLVSSRDDERALMRYSFEKYKFNDRVFELYICPTLDCNLNCIYCFENKRKGHMTIEVADAIYRYVKEEFDNQPYKELKINWYGGEPLLGMDIIDYLSPKFIAFAESKGIEYVATIITNGVLATEEIQQRLKEYKVWCAMITADGIGCMHDRTRQSRNQQSSYDDIMKHVEGILDKDIAIDFRCVVDRVNCESCLELCNKLNKRDNISFVFNQLRDLTDYQENDPRAKVMDPMTPEEHAQATLKEFLNRNPDAEEFKRHLRPLPIHCIANIDRGYVIDELGNAYECTSMPGTEELVLFNVCEPVEQRAINEKLISAYGTSNPMDAECAECAVYPLCKGGCSRTRVLDGCTTCSPYKYGIKDFLTAYSAVL